MFLSVCILFHTGGSNYYRYTSSFMVIFFFTFNFKTHLFTYFLIFFIFLSEVIFLFVIFNDYIWIMSFHMSVSIDSKVPKNNNFMAFYEGFIIMFLQFFSMWHTIILSYLFFQWIYYPILCQTLYVFGVTIYLHIESPPFLIFAW